MLFPADFPSRRSRFYRIGNDRSISQANRGSMPGNTQTGRDAISEFVTWRKVRWSSGKNESLFRSTRFKHPDQEARVPVGPHSYCPSSDDTNQIVRYLNGTNGVLATPRNFSLFKFRYSCYVSVNFFRQVPFSFTNDGVFLKAFSERPAISSGWELVGLQSYSDLEAY